MIHLWGGDGGRGHPGRRKLEVALLAMALMGLLSSCAAASNGVAKESGPAILRAAARALGASHSFEIRASSTIASSPASIDFEIEGPNRGGGTFASASVSFQAEELAGVDYFRSKTLWDQVGGQSLQTALGDRWVFIAASSSTAAQLTQAFGSLTSAHDLAAQLLKGIATAKRGKLGALGGRPTVEVTESPAAAVYVATSGRPFPLRWVQSTAGYVDFLNFGKSFHLKPPAKPLNLAAILGR
ncbi:MAG TPA: hypothetical protein VI138_07650 [Candidatus Dormibacteraeota bacterium]